MVIDFHIHTRYSFDCFLEPRAIVDRARQSGLDGIAICDHNTTQGVREIKSLAPDLYVICGEEISTAKGDILGLFLKEEIRPGRDAAEVIRAIRAQGGLAVLAHPYKWPHLLRCSGELRDFDAVEIFNARNNIPLPYLENMLCRWKAGRLCLAVIAGSDAHEGHAVGRGRTIFPFAAEHASDESLKRAILERQTKIAGSEASLGHEILSHFSRNVRSILTK